MNKISHTIQHVAIIMDGNRRWAAERGMPKLLGHTEGGKNLKRILQAAIDNHIKYLTTWALSTENLKEREPAELKYLFELFEKLLDYLGDLNANNVKVNILGDLTKLPASTANKLLQIVEDTKNNTGLNLNLAVNYGGRDELVRAFKKMLTTKISPEEITEEKISNFLDTAGMPEPELIIRTGGAQRLSGYLSWQNAYSELYFTDKKWPEFSPEDLVEAIDWFRQQQRNHGK